MSICLDAHALVRGDRNATYGNPLQDFERIAVIWSGILNMIVTPEHVGMCLIGLKLAREAYKHHRDSLVDIAGYAECLELIAETKEPPCQTPMSSAPTAATSSPMSTDTSSVPDATPSTPDAAKDCPMCGVPDHKHHHCTEHGMEAL